MCCRFKFHCLWWFQTDETFAEKLFLTFAEIIGASNKTPILFFCLPTCCLTTSSTSTLWLVRRDNVWWPFSGRSSIRSRWFCWKDEKKKKKKKIKSNSFAMGFEREREWCPPALIRGWRWGGGLIKTKWRNCWVIGGCDGWRFIKDEWCGKGATKIPPPAGWRDGFMEKG